MRRQFFFHPVAEQELNDAAAYYEAESRGLGRAFLREVQHAVQHVLEYPESAPLVNRVVRKKLVRRFPYAAQQRDQIQTGWAFRLSSPAG